MARWIVFSGFTALLVTGYFATFYEHGKAQWRGVQFVEVELQAQANAALARLGAKWARVKMDGQIATLSGRAPTEADREDAMLAVRSAAGSGGPWLGGVTQVRDETTVAPAIKPFVWIAERLSGGKTSLSGHVPGQRFRNAILAEAQKLFPQGVEDRTSVAAGHPTGPWVETAIWSLRQLAQLKFGNVRFVDATVTVQGQAADAATQSAIFLAAKSRPGPYTTTSDITISSAASLPEAPLETPVPIPASSEAERTPAVDCQKLIDRAMTNNAIPFASGSASLKVTGNRLLDGIAAMARDCDTLRFRIVGHADGTSIENNLGDLSGQRAEAVADYLEAKGIGRERLLTAGAGSAQPAGDNATLEGQARNRRVEITVLP